MLDIGYMQLHFDGGQREPKLRQILTVETWFQYVVPVVASPRSAMLQLDGRIVGSIDDAETP